MLQIPPDYMQSTQRWHLAGRPDPFTVVLGHHVTIPDEVNELALQVRTAWLGHLSPASGMAVGYTLGNCTVLYNDGLGALQIGEAPGSTAGTRAGSNAPPSNCSLLMSKRSGLAGRENRGRMFMPPFLLEESSVNQAGEFTVGNLQDSANDFLVQLALGIPMVILHTGVETPTPVTTLVVRGRLATQRRRMR